MLESLLSFEEEERRPWLLFGWAVLVCIVATIVALQVAPGIPAVSAGFFAVLFTIIPAAYLLQQLISSQEAVEEREVKAHLKRGLWERHGRDIAALLFLFAGLTLAFAVLALLLPAGTFNAQTGKINDIRGTGSFLETLTGNAPALAPSGAAAVTGSAAGGLDFSGIFWNNLQVLLMAFVLALVFGAGAVFIIVWNASVLGVFIGSAAKSLWAIPAVSLGFLPHGLPEIAAYLLAGLAGGLLSAGVLRKNPREVVEAITWDAGRLLVVAIALVFLAALVEVA